MTTETRKIYVFLHQHPLIMVNKLFVMSGMDQANASRMWANQADIPDKYIPKIVAILKLYGYTEGEKKGKK